MAIATADTDAEIDVPDNWMATAAPARFRRRMILLRVVILINLAFGLNYLIWRYFFSINMHALWFGIPMIIAETYSIFGNILFSITMWKPTQRHAPPIAKFILAFRRVTGRLPKVGVFITVYNESVELVRKTAESAMAMRHPPHMQVTVYILDDGDNDRMSAMAWDIGCQYITRGAAWFGKVRHAKAGNLINALWQQSEDDFLLILDADQVPLPHFLEEAMGYFADPEVALVQTPQYFTNVPESDPYCSRAELFYGPIQQGKDGWNAAFFCGSNAVLRREALMHMGMVNFAQEIQTHGIDAALEGDEAIPIRPFATISVTEDMATCQRLHSLGWRTIFHPNIICLGLAPDEWKAALPQKLRWAQGTLQVFLRENPMTYRPPKDASSAQEYLNTMYPSLALTPRKIGMSLGQKLNYLMTMWSYLSGPFAVIYLAAPIVYLVTGIPPVTSYTWPYFARLIPFLIVNRILFIIVAQGIKTFRGEQHNIALFPIWIRAMTTAVNNVFFGKKLGFMVTPKEKSGHRVNLTDLWTVWPQVTMMLLTALAILYGLTEVALGANRVFGILVNSFWAAYNIVLLAAAPYAALWQPKDDATSANTPRHVETVRALRGVPSAR
jgi:cellulose synthase (UDP-forming)